MTERPLHPQSPFFHEQRHAALGRAATARITVCGAGALGANLAETLARMGCQRLAVIDRDRVEMRNLSTQPYQRAEAGAPKVRALAAALYRAVGTQVEPVVVELTSANAAGLLAGSELVVDAFDNAAARAAVSGCARALDLPCLHVGFSADGLYGSGQWEPDYQPPRDVPGDPCDYPLTRPLALVLAALAASAAVDFLSTGRRAGFELTWRDLALHPDGL